MSVLSDQLKKFLPAAGDTLCDNFKKAAQFELEWIRFLRTVFNDDGSLTDEFKTAYCALDCADEGGTTPETSSTTTEEVFEEWDLSSIFLYGTPTGLKSDNTGNIVLVSMLENSVLHSSSDRFISVVLGQYASPPAPPNSKPALSMTRDGAIYLCNLKTPASSPSLGFSSGIPLDPTTPSDLSLLGVQGSTISDDGLKIAVAIPSFGVRLSTDGGASFADGNLHGFCSGICGSSDGVNLAAYISNGQIHVSDDSGATWSATASGSRPWTSICCSADGSVIIACSNPVSGLGHVHVSVDSGTTWESKLSLNRQFNSIACSDDGNHIIVALFNDHLYRSTDGGETWAAQELVRPWLLVCCNSDGTKMAAIATGENQLFLGPS